VLFVVHKLKLYIFSYVHGTLFTPWQLFIYLHVCTWYTVHTMTAVYILTRMYMVHCSHHDSCLYTYSYVHGTLFTLWQLFIYLLVCTRYTVHTMTAVYILTRMYKVHCSHYDSCLYTYSYVQGTLFTPWQLFLYLLVCTRYTVHTMTAVYILTRMYKVHCSHHDSCLYTYSYVQGTLFTPWQLFIYLLVCTRYTVHTMTAVFILTRM